MPAVSLFVNLFRIPMCLMAIGLTCVPLSAADRDRDNDPEPEAPQITVSCRVNGRDLVLGTQPLTRMQRLEFPLSIKLPENNRLSVSLAINRAGRTVVFDAVMLENKGVPIAAEEIIDAETCRDYSAVLSAADRYVAPVQEETLKAEFLLPRAIRQAEAAPLLVIWAGQVRIEGGTVVLPRGETWLTYAKDQANGYLTLDGCQGEDDELPAPLVELAGISNSGHPDGIITVYACNDFDRFYLVIDHTPDNTEDAADRAVVTVRTGTTELQFAAGIAEANGRAGFTATRQAEYPHRYYELVIPVKELGYLNNGPVEIRIELFGVGIL